MVQNRSTRDKNAFKGYCTVPNGMKIINLHEYLHEYSYLLRAHHIHIVCLQHGWFWNKNI